MHGVEFLSGILFPLLNFSIFLAVLIYCLRAPLQNFARSQHEQFIASARSASVQAEEMDKLEQEVREGRTRIEQELTALEQQTNADAEREAALIAAEGGKIAAQIKGEVEQIVTAYAAELQVELKRLIMRHVQQELQTLLPQHTTASDAQAAQSLRAVGGQE